MKKHYHLETICLVLVALGLLNPAGSAAQNPTLPPGFAQQILADSLNPTAMAFDHHGNLYLAQKDGRVFLLNETGEFLSDPVLSLELDDFNERGLAGIALHPDFDTEPWIYLYYAVRDSNFNRISRLRINGNHAVPGSEQILFECDKLSSGIHNGGAIAFGLDGKLYVGTGDGGNSSNSQSLSSSLGKVLRLNADGSIPDDNPFYNTLSGKARAIYAYGLRNPFNMSIQPGSGRIFVNDVGQGAFEEINEIMPGRNYGWSQIEGPIAAQTPPPDYQDPFFAYPHAAGCAIVGAAFYNPDMTTFPADYAEKYFFSDYCNGIVQLLDPNTQSVSDTFATGLKQPVAFAVNPNTGDLYYLMRSGIGGGSVVDNTSTNNGTLWRVFYTGSGAPFVSVPPQDILLPIGENARFELQVLGTAPFQYQWQKNGQDLAGANAAILEINNVQLADSGALFRCIISNADGADTSTAALLQVTSNHRPQPQILFPVLGKTYKAGEIIYIQGVASDPEQGALPAGMLSWRIDFHHDTHIHPVLGSVSGISEGTFQVPLAGETSPNTWYRIYLTAIDSAGLEGVVWVEIFPEKTSVKMEGPPGLSVNVDGVIRPMPYVFEGLKGQQRIVQASQQWLHGDTLWVFEKWRTATEHNLIFSFPMPDTPGLVLYADYTKYLLGNGVGLHGEYFVDPEFDLDEEPKVLRRDTVINFDWGDASPFPNQIPVDGFTVRWSGFVQSIFNEPYTFSVRSDDGCRLWVGDSLLIDRWVAQGTEEYFGTIQLAAGTKTPIRLEYLEIGGGANVALFWSSPNTPKALVPKRQLYPIDPYEPATIRGFVWHDVNYNEAIEAGEKMLQGVTVLLYDGQDSTLITVDETDNLGRYKFSGLVAGAYFLRFLPAAEQAHLLPRTHLNTAGQTDMLVLEPLESLLWNASFVDQPASISGYCWQDLNGDAFRQTTEPGLPDISVLLFSALDSVLLEGQLSGTDGRYWFNYQSPGMYFLQFSNALNAQNLHPALPLNPQGLSPVLELSPHQGLLFDAAFKSAGAATQALISVQIQPNPVRDDLLVRVSGEHVGVTRLRLMDVMGREFDRVEKSAVEDYSWILDVRRLDPGIYFLIVEDAQSTVARKFVKD